MTILAFCGGVLTGIFLTVWILWKLSTKQLKKRRILQGQAMKLYTKAAELFDTAKIWYMIGNKEESDKALDEAQRLAEEAQGLEDEADGRKAS